MRRCTVGLALAIVMTAAAPAHAQDLNSAISAYNEAATSGDTQQKISTAKALGREAMNATGRDDAALLAIEAAKTICLQGDCKDAVDLIEWASGKPLPEGTISRENADLAEAYINWRVKSDSRNRESLDAALEKMVDSDLTLITLAAFTQRYQEDVSKKHWHIAAVSASQASEYLVPFRGAIGETWSNAEMTGIISNFNAVQEPDSALDMARHSVALRELAAAFDSDLPEWLVYDYFRSTAWASSITAYFDSGGGVRKWSNIKGPETRSLEDQVHDIYSDTEAPGMRLGPLAMTDESGQLPLCSGHFKKKKWPRYPRMGLRGMMGTVISQVSVKDGRVDDVRVLAAVPAEGFADETVRALKYWEWVVDDGTPGETCSLNGANLIQQVTFLLE